MVEKELGVFETLVSLRINSAFFMHDSIFYRMKILKMPKIDPGSSSSALRQVQLVCTIVLFLHIKVTLS